jgi:hypothetical protein
MIKNFKRSDIQTTPFVATKSWVLTSFHNQDILLLESGYFNTYFWNSISMLWETWEIPWDISFSYSTTTEVPLAEEFVDYQGGSDYPILNRECNIALEQQEEDKVLYEEGQHLTGPFYPDSDPKNNTGTYKRLLYNQIKNSFYNEWNDPTKMFGLENIDFQLSKTKKFLGDNFRLFNVSNAHFGEKMLENSITLVDNSLDDNFEIVDDGFGNIIARENLFSRVQEVREFTNLINVSITSSYCDTYNSNIESRQSGGESGSYGTGSIGYLPSSNCQPW